MTKVPYLRSLRLRALIVPLVTLALPPLLVLVWLWAERGYEHGMQANAQFSAAQARELLLRVRRLPARDGDRERCGGYDLAEIEPLRELAQGHRVRLELLDREGHKCFDHDADDYVDLSQRAGSVVFGPHAANAGTPEPRANVSASELDAARRAGSSSSCGETPDKEAHECHALIALDDETFLFVQDSAWRPASILSVLGQPLLKLTLLAVPIAIAMAWLLSRRLVRPIERLREEVLTKTELVHAAGDPSPIRGDEVDHLNASFNALLRALDERREEESRVAADLVHELKNPLASIRAAGEALQKPHMDPGRRIRLGRVIEHSSARLFALASEYLEIARAEARLPGEPRHPVDLAGLTRGICSRFADDPRFSDVEIVASGAEQATVFGIAHRLESVLSNLIENAALASRPNGRVAVAVEREEERVTVRVTDSGPGIPEHELPALFERFHTTRRESGGTGLGLASSRAVIEAHGGTLSVMNADAGGACFAASLPASGLSHRFHTTEGDVSRQHQHAVREPAPRSGL